MSKIQFQNLIVFYTVALDILDINIITELILEYFVKYFPNNKQDFIEFLNVNKRKHTIDSFYNSLNWSHIPSLTTLENNFPNNKQLKDFRNAINAEQKFKY